MSTTTTARAWLVIAHGGGRWSLPEVRAKLPTDNPSTIETALHAMADQGCLDLIEPAGANQLQRFAVTAHCYIPRGLTHWEVLEAVGMQLRPDVEDDTVARGMTVRDVMRLGAQKEAA